MEVDKKRVAIVIAILIVLLGGLGYAISNNDDASEFDESNIGKKKPTLVITQPKTEEPKTSTKTSPTPQSTPITPPKANLSDNK